jgi:hemerythrin-like domain-containing protein
MAETMTMNRVIHEAVRRDLARLESALAATQDGDLARAGQLERAYANLHRELTQHHEGEDQNVFPYLASVGVPPDLLTVMDDEHHAMAEALGETRQAMAAYASSGSAADAERARTSVVRTRDVVDRHLDHEERELEPLLAPHMQSAEWKTVEKKLRPRSVVVSGKFLAWIQDGMSNEGRAYLRATIPPPVTAVLGRVAGRAYHREVAPVWRS